MRRFNWNDVPAEEMPTEAGTVRRRFVSGKKMTIALVTFEPHSATEPHRHENEQFAFVLSGTLEFTVEGVPVTVQGGEAIHLAPNEWHGARSLDEPATVLDVFSPPRADWEQPQQQT